jgi:hypothetical protein
MRWQASPRCWWWGRRPGSPISATTSTSTGPQWARRSSAGSAHEHVSDKQLVALARDFFLKLDRTAGTPTPT